MSVSPPGATSVSACPATLNENAPSSACTWMAPSAPTPWMAPVFVTPGDDQVSTPLLTAKVILLSGSQVRPLGAHCPTRGWARAVIATAGSGGAAGDAAGAGGEAGELPTAPLPRYATRRPITATARTPITTIGRLDCRLGP